MQKNEKKIFERLNERLKESDMNLTLVVVGGFVLSHYGIRSTHDVDGFYKSSKRLDAIIEQVGNEFGINTDDELWLNNSVQNMNVRPADSICDVLYQFSNLTVLMPPLDYIAGMKLMSAREQDVQDVGEIIYREKIEDPGILEERIKVYGFNAIDESLILEAFGYAYGMAWLEKYYIENEDKINERISGR